VAAQEGSWGSHELCLPGVGSKGQQGGGSVRRPFSSDDRRYRPGPIRHSPSASVPAGSGGTHSRVAAARRASQPPPASMLAAPDPARIADCPGPWPSSPPGRTSPEPGGCQLPAGKPVSSFSPGNSRIRSSGAGCGTRWASCGPGGRDIPPVVPPASEFVPSGVEDQLAGLEATRPVVSLALAVA
jgi:hypothetical protein